MPLKLLSFAVPLAVTVLFYGASATPAHAYLDPGTGSMILQVLLGGVAGLALVGKLYWHRFLTAIGVRPVAVDDVADSSSEARPTSRSEN